MPKQLFEAGATAQSPIKSPIKGPMDRLVRTACETLGAPMGLVSVYDDDRIPNRTLLGLDGIIIPPVLPMADALIAQGPGAVMVIADGRTDPRVCDHPFVVGPPRLRFYAGATICDRQGRPIGAIGVMSPIPRGTFSSQERAALQRYALMAGDLVELSQAQSEREAKRETLQLAEELIGIGHFRMDLASGEVFWSDQLFRIHGYLPGEIEPSAEMHLEHYHPADAALLRERLQKACGAAEGYDIRLRLRRRDGQARTIRSTARCEHDALGVVTAVFGVTQDITDTIRAQTALIEARDQAESHAQAKSDFLANTSHELRTPLTSVIGFSSFLGMSQNLSDKERHYVDRIQVASRTLLGVINDVLDYSKLEAGAFDLDQTPFHPRALAETAVAMVEEQIQRTGLVVTINVADDVPEALIGDEAHLRQVIVNFLSNAVKFTPSGSIDLSMTVIADRLRVAVTDTGIGVAPEAIDRLFDRFFQANGSTTRPYGGTGLGLAISRRLVEMMGGTIGAHSEPGRGSTFWFEAPLRSVLARAQSGSDAPPRLLESRRGGPTHGRGRVLIADDSAATRRLVGAILVKLGLEVDMVANGAEAVNAARTRHYDAILMDVHMPVLDGVEAARTIHAMQGSGLRTPIIALTAACEADQVQRYLQAGMVGHIGKPLRPDELVRRLDLALSATRPPLSDAAGSELCPSDPAWPSDAIPG